MTKKVQVSREVAKTLDRVKELRFDFDWVIKWAASGELPGEYGVLHELSLTELATALLVGYEVDKTPEEKVYMYFQQLRCEEYEADWCGDRRASAQFRQGLQSVEHTLELLGLKIEGVNA